MKNSDWDLDLRDGERGESEIADLLSMDTVEVKTDKRWQETGNLYVETECYYVNDNAWKPSGIRVSEATHWAFLLQDIALIMPLWQLREAVYTVGRPITCDIQPNPTRGYLITPAQIIECVKAARDKLLKDMAEQEGWTDPAEWEDV
jgi:hypothetical protein